MNIYEPINQVLKHQHIEDRLIQTSYIELNEEDDINRNDSELDISQLSLKNSKSLKSKSLKSTKSSSPLKKLSVKEQETKSFND